jgi:hypothetical protein
MNERAAFALSALLTLGYTVSATADVGITDKCQEEVKELEEKIEENKDDYTSEARRKARAHLAAAKTNRANPAKCRENLRDARQDLRDGKK